MNKKHPFPQKSRQLWLESKPDYMLSILADEGEETAWRIMEERKQARRRTLKADYGSKIDF
jgi:hypothetical protein